jgi:hypothetical protein
MKSLAETVDLKPDDLIVIEGFDPLGTSESPSILGVEITAE